MHARTWVLAPLAAGFAIFAWGAISHMLIPWPGQPVRDFTDAPAVVSAMRTNAPQNGVYFAAQGVFAAVSIRPDLSDRTAGIGPNLAIEFATNVLEALLLLVILRRAGGGTVLSRAGTAAVAALAAAAAIHVSHANWWGFSVAYAIAETGDLLVGWTVAGLVLGLFLRRA